MHRFESACGREVLGIHHHFDVARIELFHAALQHDPAAIDKHQIGEHVLHLLHLMGGHHDGAAAIEIIVQQGIVKLFAIKDVQAKCRLIEHEQAGIDRHHDRQMQLRHHSFR